MVTCTKCSKEIKSKQDLVVASSLLIPKAYHRKCYADILTNEIHSPLLNHPINTQLKPTNVILGIIAILIFLAILVFWLFSMNNMGLLTNPVIIFVILLVAAAFIYGIADRVYSYLAFESKLK